MSELSRDAQELLTGSPPADGTDTGSEQKSPAEERIEERLAAIDTTPPAWRREPEKPTMVPRSVVETVEGKATAEEQRANQYQAAMEAAGFTFDEQGNPIPPAAGAVPGQGGPQGFGPPAGAPMAPPHQWEATRALAEQLSIEPGLLMQALGEYASAISATTMGPLIDSTVASTEKALEQSDPDFKLIRDSYRYHLSVLPPAVRVSPLASDLARRLAIADHLDEITERRSARKGGRVVGKFVENAAPGTQEAPPPPSFSESTLEKLKQWGVTPKEIAAAESRREVSGRNRRE